MKKRYMVACLLLSIWLIFAGCTKPSAIYVIGEYGPGGGIVFYDQGSVINNWRYLEVTSMDMPVEPSWGPIATSTFAIAQIIGTGETNTTAIVSTYGTGTAHYAARYCAEDISGGAEDWFLPSKDELMEIYTNLKLCNIGNLIDGYYWSSSENDSNTAFALNFTDGTWSALNKSNHPKTRSIRAFQ